MKNTKVWEVLKALGEWDEGKAPIQRVADLLGDDDNDVGRMLMLNGLADFGYKPVEGFSSQQVVNAVLLYLAMRGTMSKKAKQ